MILNGGRQPFPKGDSTALLVEVGIFLTALPSRVLWGYLSLKLKFLFWFHCCFTAEDMSSGPGTELSPESFQEGLCICSGGLDILKFDEKSTDLQCFIIQFRWAWSFVWGG